MNTQVRCQSCGMPVLRDDELGTNFDGSFSTDYCVRCYEHGEFINPSIALEQMVAKTAGMLAFRMGIPYSDAQEMLSATLPGLKRWREVAMIQEMNQETTADEESDEVGEPLSKDPNTEPYF